MPLFIMDPIVGSALGLPPSQAGDPHAVYVALMHKLGGPFQAVLTRAVKRTKLSTITIPNLLAENDPAHKSGVKHATVNVASTSGGVFELGVRIAAFVTLGGPAAAETLLDESRRMVMGMPIGPSVKHLDGPLDNAVSDTTLTLLAPKAKAHALDDGSRGLFGIDDAILIASIPLLVVLVPIVLPLIISLGGQAINFVQTMLAPKPAAGAAGAPGSAPPAGNPVDQLLQDKGIEQPGGHAGIVVAVVAALVLTYVVLRHMHKKG